MHFFHLRKLKSSLSWNKSWKEPWKSLFLQIENRDLQRQCAYVWIFITDSIRNGPGISTLSHPVNYSVWEKEGWCINSKRDGYSSQMVTGEAVGESGL